MKTVHAADPIANIDGGPESVADAKMHMEKAFTDFVEKADELGLTQSIAALYRDDPLQAEFAVRDRAFNALSEIFGKAFGALDGHGSSLEIDGETHRKAKPTLGRAMTIFGPVEFLRSRYRPSRGEAVIPVEATLGLTEGGMTPAAANFSMRFMSNMTARESEDTWKAVCGEGPSASTLVKLSQEAGACVEECSEELLQTLREQEEVPEKAASLHVSLDGVMMRLNGETEGETPMEAGWHEASCGVVALVDAEGEVLESKCFGQLPETGKTGLKAKLRAEMFHWLRRRPDLKVSVVADGAKDNWTFLETLFPDIALLDYWHAVQHLGEAGDAALGLNTRRGKAWFEKWRKILRDDPKGVDKVIDALRYLVRKGTGADKVRKELAYFCSNRHRMNYADAAAQGYAIGSGAVEAANKVLVTTRMKRSGQSWGREGGQGVLTFRSLLKSGRFERAWAEIAPRLSRSGSWKPPYCANDNRQIPQAALAA